MSKVKVISAYNGRCGIDNLDLHISRRWPARGSVVTFEEEQIEELMYDPAFSNMLREGRLYIEEMEVKKKIGLEPEDAEEPTIILMSDKQLERFWKNMPASQFKLEIAKLTHEQIIMLAEYAVAHGDQGSIEKANILTKASGRQILKGIELEKQIKED